MKADRKNLIAVCGKGGSGKTALTALLAKYFLQHKNGKLLVIDADPTMCLPGTLGVRADITVNDIRERIIREARSAGNREKRNLARSLDYMLLEALVETESFSMLVMGRPESLGCYCPVNDLLREGIKSMASYFDTILIDGEAGVEQISRQVIRSVNFPLIVSDVSARGLQTARLIREVIESHNIIQYEKLGLVLNRVRNVYDARQLAQKTGIEIFGCIPEDEIIGAFDMQAVPLLDVPDDSPAYQAVFKMLSNF